MISLVRLEQVGVALLTAGIREQAAHRNTRGREVKRLIFISIHFYKRFRL
jgi:hypothetical protein